MLRSLISLLRVPAKDATHFTALSLKSNKLRDLTVGFKNVHTTSKLQKTDDRKFMLASMPKLDEGTEGEKFIDIDTITSSNDLFPDENTPDRLFNGIPFKNVPIVNIRVSHNNTILTLTDHKGTVKVLRSCGVEGFKNTRKGTNIAAQATAISFSAKVLENGAKMVRVKVRGLGPGRMVSNQFEKDLRRYERST